MARLSEVEKEKIFKRNKNLVNRFTRNFLAKNKIGIVHGTRATNVQLPRDLKRKTTDWDVFVKKPRLRAEQLEKVLDKRFGGDFFRIKKGTASPEIKVWKVKSNVTDETLIDFASTNRKVKSISKRGVRFATLKDQQMIAERNIKKPGLKFRRAKDKDLLNRIKKSKRRRIK